MSHFKPHMPMPYDLMEFQAKILENRGLHYNFPYGYKPTKEPKKHFIVNVGTVVFRGLTFRGFFYAPGPDYVELELRWSAPGGYDYYETTKIQGTDVGFKYRGPGSLFQKNQGDEGTSHKINAPGYYSIAVRVHDDKLTKLAAFFKDQYLSDAYVSDLNNGNYELRIKGNSHYLMSLHASDELEANPDFPKHYFGQNYYFGHPALGISSYWIMDCIVNNKDLPLKVNIVGGKQEAKFSLQNEKRGDEVTIYIRSVLGGWQVTTSFQDTSVYIKHKSANHQNYIYPSISTNCNILTQHAEQGLQRY